MKRLRFFSILALLFAALLAVSQRAWLSRSATLSFGLKSSALVTLQVFWTETPGGPFAAERSRSVRVGPGGKQVSFSLPAARVERLRIDFGNGSTPVRVGPMTVAGRETRVLDWRDFASRHDISRFDVDARGAADVVASGGDPYAVCDSPLGIAGRPRPNLFALLWLALVAALLGWLLAGPNGVLARPVPRDGEPICTVPFLILAALLVAARFALTARLPPWFGPSPWDDIWFLNTASALVDGEWLGPFDHHTLIKGCFGPMVLAFCAQSGIPYLLAQTCLYVLSCVFFIHVASRISRNRIFLLAALALLLFNPLSHSFFSWQRVHRNGMPIWQVPFAFGCLYMTYLSSRGRLRSLAMWAVLSGLALWVLHNTREDGGWIWPFALGCLGMSAFSAWQAGAARRERRVRALACLLPLLVVVCGNAAVCLANWRVYGLPIRNNRDAGNYAKVMNDLYVIEPDPEDEARLTAPGHESHYHGIYYSTLLKAYGASPTFALARKHIDPILDTWSRGMGYHGRDLFHDHMLFALRDGVHAAGFYESLPRSEAFYGDVHRELSEAFADGRLSRRGISITPLAAPLRKGTMPRVLGKWIQTLAYLAKFKDTEAQLVDTGESWRMVPPRDVLERFERLSGERMLSAGEVPAVQPHADRANAVSAAYSTFLPWLLLAALVCYAGLTLALVWRRFRTPAATGGWLLASGILASVFAHTAGIAYVSATTFWATRSYYLVPSFQMTLMFVVVVAAACLAAARERIAGAR